MSVIIRKRSPRAPSISLKDAIERAEKIYSAEGKNSAPVDVIAKHLGYSSSGNGAAATVFASLGYFGIVERPKDGYMVVTKDFESYKFTPDELLRKQIAVKWLKTPSVFSDLIDKYPDGLPSEATLKFDLITRGFTESTAGECLAAFLESVQFADYYRAAEKLPNDETKSLSVGVGHIVDDSKGQVMPKVDMQALEGNDRIPVRLAGGRRAWLEIPQPFYDADKERVIAQIKLLLTDDEQKNGI